MKVNKPAQWLMPFIENVQILVPKMRHVDLLTLRKPPKDKITRTHGSTNYNEKTKKYNIIVHTHFCRMESASSEKFVFSKFSPIETLECLAHEIAHIYHWEHSPKHKLLECKIKSRFMRKLERDGFVSDEQTPDFYKGEK